MDIGSVFLILALLILVGIYVGRPLFARKTISVRADEHEFSALLAERDRLINALRELDFDHALGKIPAEDYPAQRAALLQRGADILRQIDERQIDERQIDERQYDASELAASGLDTRFATDEKIAASLIPSARETGREAVEGKGQADDPLEMLIASRRRERQDKSAGFCPNCGRPIQKSDQFCPKCGTAQT